MSRWGFLYNAKMRQYKNMVSSFDIFDTCLVRKCGTPENVFLVLAKNILPMATEQEILLFVNIRINAEIKARQSINAEDITLDKIYEHADFSALTSLSREDLCSMEISTEMALWSPVYETQRIIESKRQRGDKIIFISDMYLPSACIKEWLRDNAIMQNGDALFVSGEIGYTKKTGHLYEYIAKELALPFKHWTHYGDYKLSDYIIPKKYRIHANLVAISHSPYQNKWIESSYNTKYQFASLCAGISRAICASYPKSPNVDFAADIIAPLLCTFVFRVMCNAQNENITSLFFASRDAKILHHIANELKPLFPNIQNLTYFFISRDAIKYSQKDDIIRYYKEIGLAQKNNKVGIVDTGSSGNSGCTFQLINSILSEYQYSTAKGYFFHYEHVNDTTIYSEVSACPLMYLSPKKFADLQMINSTLLEGFFTITMDRSLKSYTKEGIKFKANDDLSLTDREEISSLHFKICERWIKYAMECGLLNYLNNVFDTIALPTLLEFWNHPSPHYVLALNGYKIDGKDYISRISILNFVGLIFGIKTSKYLIWKEGSFTLSRWGEIIQYIKNKRK